MGLSRQSYVPVNPSLARERTNYAYAKWCEMDDDEREPLMPTMKRLMKINHMGEMGAVELLFVLGTYLNMNERMK